MKAPKGYTKDYYRKEINAPVVKEFDTIEAAAIYLSEKHNASVKHMTSSIMNDTNCDAVYFPDGSAIVYEIA